MLKRMNSSKIVISLILSLALMLSLMSTSVFAVNSPGNKAINITGYEYISTTALKVFFDKNCSAYIHKEQFKIETEGGTDVPISSAIGSTGSGWTNSYAPTGTTATITPQNPLSYNTRYKVTISSTLLANNGLTISSYFKRQNITFYFKTPDSNGTYQGNPQVTFLQSETGAGAPEESVAVISDMPMDSNSISTIKNGTHLFKYTSGNWNELIYDGYVNTGVATPGAAVYAIQVNNAHTCLFFPMTLGGTGSGASGAWLAAAVPPGTCPTGRPRARQPGF
jgi:hypothetical protein